MHILDNIPIVVGTETINSAYLKLLSEFTQEDNIYESRSAIISIKNVVDSQLPNQVIEPFNGYYKIFVQNYLLEQKWNFLDKEWYLSYARRIMLKRNGVNLWDKSKQELLENPNSRRCVIHTYRDDDDFLNYLPSLLSIQFTIENNCMNMLTVWRSKELYTAFPVNMLCMHSLMRMMFNDVKAQYGKLRIGVYTEVIGALHKLPNKKKPLQFGDSLIDMDLEKVKFYWSIIENGKENEYDRNY